MSDTDCSDDLNDIIDTPVPPDIPPPPPPAIEGNFMDTDNILVLNRIDSKQGKFHRNLVDLDFTGTSNTLVVDADGEGTRTILGSLVYYAFDARGSNKTLRLDWKSSSDETICGTSKAKTAGTIGQVNDTKNAEITCIFRARNLITGTPSRFHASINPRGSGHSETNNECTLQAGGRHPYQQGGRHPESV